MQENKMAVEPIGPLMMKMGTPIVLSMMLQALYNIVDSAYLSNMKEAGEQALTALGLSFPVQLLMIAIAVGTGVGVNALIANALGQGNQKRASRAVGNAVTLGIVISIVFIIFGVFGVEWYTNSQNVSNSLDPIVVAMANDYLRINCIVSFGIVFFSIFEKVIQATGRSFYSTVAQVTGAVVNIVMDPIMIYGWLGCPEMGVSGAAWATVLGQIVSAIMVVGFHLRLDHEIENRKEYLKLDANIVKNIYKIGLPAIISQALLTVMTYGLNIILGSMNDIGENAVTVYGLYCKIQQLIIFASVGMRDVITPIVSFNVGSKNYHRVKEGIRYGLLYTSVLMIIGTVVIELFASNITQFFSLSDMTFNMCVDCMRIVSLGFLFAGLCTAFQGVFQGIGRGIEPLVIALGRQVVFLLPVAYLFSKMVTGYENSSMIWWAFLIAETITLLVTIAMYQHAIRNMQVDEKAFQEKHA